MTFSAFITRVRRGAHHPAVIQKTYSVTQAVMAPHRADFHWWWGDDGFDVAITRNLTDWLNDNTPGWRIDVNEEVSVENTGYWYRFDFIFAEEVDRTAYIMLWNTVSRRTSF